MRWITEDDWAAEVERASNENRQLRAEIERLTEENRRYSLMLGRLIGKLNADAYAHKKSKS